MVLVAVVIGSVTPWPSAMLIRSVFEKGGAATVAEMTPYVPDVPLREQTDIAYADGGASHTLSVYTTAPEGGALPTVFWIHGGAWISGSDTNVAPYLKILAAEGYTTIGVNYTLGPEGVYPAAVEELNDALAYVIAHAEELNVDPGQIVLAGDSAGAQLASQMATLSTNSAYADLVGIQPALPAGSISGVILNCGVYDMDAMADLEGLPGWGFKVALWAYTGTKTWAEDYRGATMSTIDFADAGFPSTFITGGNGDGLTWLQSIPMAQHLRAEGVDVTELFWPARHEPALPHEYQFHLNLPEAREALQQTIDYLARTVDRAGG